MENIVQNALQFIDNLRQDLLFRCANENQFHDINDPCAEIDEDICDRVQEILKEDIEQDFEIYNAENDWVSEDDILRKEYLKHAILKTF